MVARLPTLKTTLIIISITVLLILVSQVYRTLNNYEQNKLRFINDVQLALDLSIENYYADKARSEFSVMMMTDFDSTTTSSVKSLSVSRDSLTIETDIVLPGDSSYFHSDENGFEYFWSSRDSGNFEERIHKEFIDSNRKAIRLNTFKIVGDSTERLPFAYKDLTQLTQKIMISTSEERLEMDRLIELLADEFERKNISIGYQLAYQRGGMNPQVEILEYPLSVASKSTYLKPNETLNLHFENAPMLILKRGALDLVISFLIVFCVIGALLYLYRIIRGQKELAMIKDDLIGNVTHEFKTPIATVSTALEGIANFNEANDPEKTKRYVSISHDQLKKLNLMVEKLMETATIDSGEIEINRIETDITELTRKVMENFQLRLNEKTLTAELPNQAVFASVDPFHFENILTNLIDNAIKYGGNKISVSLQQVGKQLVFRVIDNGGAIEKPHQQRIFQKLYRIPKGNQHDVKGFGIGLYYTKAMVEKHGGEISLEVSPGKTCFTIVL